MAGEFLFLGEVRCSDFTLAGDAGAGVTVDVSFLFPGEFFFVTFGVDVGALVSVCVFFSGVLFLPFGAFGVDVGALVSLLIFFREPYF